ncbi:UDP-D-apiose/UDP-D-xylose synthase [Euphorbia peplus]|nr:UDP-D-apiose/UDP-D-xylose synthase [Euphorbia peplus]
MEKGKEMIEPLKICIIAGAGFIGMNLCSKLLEKKPHKLIILDISCDKINNLLLNDRTEFHKIEFKTEFRRLNRLIMKSDLIINLEAFREPADHSTSTISSTILYEHFLIVNWIGGAKRLIHFSTCDVFGKTIESFLPKDNLLHETAKWIEVAKRSKHFSTCNVHRKTVESFLPKDNALGENRALKEDVSPCILGSVVDQRWSYACAKQFTEQLILDEGTEHDRNCTIVRPFNWIGQRSDLVPDTDGPHDNVPSTLACFTQNILNGDTLLLVDGGQYRRTFCFIDDAIEAVLLIIDNPEKANRQVFNVGNPANEVSVKDLATMMIQAYAKVTDVPLYPLSTRDVTAREFYGRAYNVSHRRIPDVTNIAERLGWKPKTSELSQLLEDILAYHDVMHLISSPPSEKPRIGSSSDT